MFKSDVADTLVDLLQLRARCNSESCGYTFCSEVGERSTLKVNELERRARAIAAALQEFARPGDRALLVYPAGLDFISAFFGCVFAGILPVPATYPKPRRPMPRLSAISADCGATIALTALRTTETLDLARTAPDLLPLRWIATDTIAEDAAGDWRNPNVVPDDIAFLQYTSGSTSQPKGVMVSHRNLMHNLEMIRYGFDMTGIHPAGVTPVGVSWLPAYHDMGLIGGIFTTLFHALHTTLLPPASFLHRPLSWLQTISDMRATMTGAPNFAYELCVTKTTPEERAALDLSSLRLAFCAAEPIRADTLRRFADAFVSSGFRADTFYPCYGLAEVTLMAAGDRGPAHPKIKSVCRTALSNHQVEVKEGPGPHVQEFVACGGTMMGQEIAIVDPNSSRRLPLEQVGEVWIAGPSAACGYWNRPEDTAQVFHAQIDGEPGSRYVRSGDLGFLSDGQLYITGRLKDVIIIRGRNHYPQDIEHTVGGAHPLLQPDQGAAISIDKDGQERVVVIQEIDRHHRDADFSEVLRAILRAVTIEHEVEVEAIVLIRQASLPRTTSGKVQRSLCRARYLQGELKTIAEWTSRRNRLSTPPSLDRDLGNGQSTNGNGRPSSRHASPVDDSTAALARNSDAKRFPIPERPMTVEEKDRLAERIEEYLIEFLVDRCGLIHSEFDRHKPFAEYGLDSFAAVELSQELESWLHVRISTVMAWNYPTPASMASFLAELAGAASGESSPPADDPTAISGETEFEQLLAQIEALSEQEVQAALASEDDAEPVSRAYVSGSAQAVQRSS